MKDGAKPKSSAQAKRESTAAAETMDRTVDGIGTMSLESLQSDEQRLVLDTVAQVRKCGLESILALPQIVVCGDQSAGKSSVLEALTEIPFPRNDELCTRFATEIIMRRATVDSLTIRVIPDDTRSGEEKKSIEEFQASITDFSELPEIMDRAMEVMGIGKAGIQPSAFARDILSIEIEGPSRPQLTLVDLPGLIQNETKGVTKADVELVQEITDRYISQSRTICLAVVSATNDYANQGILSKVRKVDPDGERTLGIITKPDRLPAGSGTESAYIALARNEDIFFKLGWHVVKNRSFEEGSDSFLERNASEASYFRTSNFKCLPKESVGIDALRERLSRLLFEHVKQELPQLHSDLSQALEDSKTQLATLGDRRATAENCKEYLTRLSLDFHRVCAAANEGHYEGPSFRYNTNEVFSTHSRASVRRLRAIVQKMNAQFSHILHEYGHSYHIAKSDEPQTEVDLSIPVPSPAPKPVHLSRSQAFSWSVKWPTLAEAHVEEVADVCRQFLTNLLEDMCPKDIISRLWSLHFEEALKQRNNAASDELRRIVYDHKEYPINYNHYYTDTVRQRQKEREQGLLATAVENATSHTPITGCRSGHHTSTKIDIDSALDGFNPGSEPDMEKASCEEALDRLYAIYKVSQKTFIANITTQVVERHIVRGLEDIFSPIFVSKLSDADAQAIASEPASCKRQRDFFQDRIEKLKSGHTILRRVMKTMVL
ncbi:dynamin family protein-like protein [Bimuria novae-zelandiae CBS 107.79]|uniref:Dynamin family protein-like protein n=1 Tax=Bimuria novae-zelandiae CBS 107.79 TaxID=1447943 RepID=A0A6A5V529_9PLEO|nr:dynamin family protein-like protein [Bimuria novae-zelandiae CBS 107.79]